MFPEGPKPRPQGPGIEIDIPQKETSSNLNSSYFYWSF